MPYVKVARNKGKAMHLEQSVAKMSDFTTEGSRSRIYVSTTR